MPDMGLPAVPTPGDEIRPEHRDHRNFARYVMSDVYALLDFLSGRATPSLTPPPQKRSHSASHFRRRSDGPGGAVVVTEHRESESDTFEDDLNSHKDFLIRTMRIGSELDAADGKISHADAAWLIEARNQLNLQARPATGNSIVFTLRVIDKILPPRTDDDAKHRSPRYFIEDEIQDELASRLAKFVKRTIRIMLYGLLSITVILSTYVACGKLLLDTRDQVNRDFQGNMNVLGAAMNQPSNTPTDDLIKSFCDNNKTNFSIEQTCWQHGELEVRKGNIHTLLTRWIWPFSTPAPLDALAQFDNETIEQEATTVVGVLGNYLLPILYGALGSFGFVLRRLNRQLADFLLMPRDLRANQIRITLGVVTGACIGLFVNSSVGAATSTGLGGAAVTLSASGIAFLAGYGVEAVFKMLDELINHVFRIDAERKDTPHA